jgi:chromosome segregation ATPase
MNKMLNTTHKKFELGFTVDGNSNRKPFYLWDLLQSNTNELQLLREKVDNIEDRIKKTPDAIKPINDIQNRLDTVDKTIDVMELDINQLKEPKEKDYVNHAELNDVVSNTTNEITDVKGKIDNIITMVNDHSHKIDNIIRNIQSKQKTISNIDKQRGFEI